MSSLLQDLRLAVRMLWKNRAASAVALLGLATGIGANTAIFSGINAVSLQPLPYPEAHELVALSSFHRERGPSPSSYADFADWRTASQSFAGMAAVQQKRVTLTGEEPERVQAALVTEDFLPLLARRPLLGRTFSREEHRAGAEHVAVLGEGLWRRRFGADPAVVGRGLELDGGSYTVIGVLPQDVRLPPQTELWLPLDPAAADLRERGSRGLSVVARLADDASLEQAATEMATIAQRLEQQYPDSNSGQGVTPVLLRESLAGGAPKRLLILQLAVVFLLLIACFNVAGLLLASASVRRGEIGIRAALGADRQRLARQFLTEAALLFLLGGAAGLAVAYGGSGLIRALIPGEALGTQSLILEPRVLLFTLGLSLLTGLLVGLVPALRLSRPDFQVLLAEGRTGLQSAASHRLRKVFVTFQVALALMLLTAVGLMLRSFWLLQRVDPGFETSNVLSLQLAAEGFRYYFPVQRQTLYREAATRAAQLPDVKSAAFTTALPLGGHSSIIRFFVQGRPPADLNEGYRAFTSSVSPGYFRTLGIPIVRGRTFTAADTADSEPVVIVGRTLANALLPQENPVGQRLSFGTPDGDTYTIVGVVGDVRHTGLDQEPGMQVYHAIDQTAPSEVTLVVRTVGPPERAIPAIRKAIWAVDPALPADNVQTMAQLLRQYFARGTALIRLLGAFSLATLVLAAAGVFGLVSFNLAQRSHEIGVRMALGASLGDVMTLAVRQGLVPTLVGLLLGLPLAFGLTQVLARVLFGVQPLDPVAFTGSVLLLVLAAGAAALLPSRRALRVDPVIAMRAE